MFETVKYFIVLHKFRGRRFNPHQNREIKG